MREILDEQLASTPKKTKDDLPMPFLALCGLGMTVNTVICALGFMTPFSTEKLPYMFALGIIPLVLLVGVVFQKKIFANAYLGFVVARFLTAAYFLDVEYGILLLFVTAYPTVLLIYLFGVLRKKFE